jgi:hypothetical protein
MIKFFRKIRYNLIEKNKTGKYFKYAIGEIILVVIGILIALSINNRNELRKAKIKEDVLYQNILIDLDNEEKLLNNTLVYYKEHSDSYYHIYNETIGKARHDSTSLRYNNLRWHIIFDLIVTNKHKIAISEISSNNITELLIEKANIEVSVSQANQSFNDYKNETMIPFFIRHGIYDSKAVFESEKYNFSPLVQNNFIRYDRLKSQYENVEFAQLLVELRIRTSWAIFNLEDLIKKNNEISMTLEQELKKITKG